MSKQHKARPGQDVIAALGLSAAGPWGVQKETVLRNLKPSGQVSEGRSEAGVPPSAEDRPTLAAFRRLERENELLIGHAEALASALGACPNCWGTIADCEDCCGTGRPGAFPPDRAGFDHFVLPVVMRLLNDGWQSDTIVRAAQQRAAGSQ
ncbi:hypothetical protein [Paracoccus siganidrum]|uniref:hypothetical protein n=1 Tax=Paracoccus siganidrum TaxID=1276757 RepID=UPI0011C448C3|nr:hypothetical protein [Paracoccus siganidrum]